jgi:hypothetical protein
MFLVSTTKKYEVEKKSISTFIRSRMRPPSPPVRPHHPARTHNPARRGPPPSSVDHAATSPSAGTHCGLASTIAPPPPLRLLIRNEPRRHLRQRAADLAAAIRGISNLHAVGDLGPAATVDG